jgi:hypothetical protein
MGDAVRIFKQPPSWVAVSRSQIKDLGSETDPGFRICASADKDQSNPDTALRPCGPRSLNWDPL